MRFRTSFLSRIAHDFNNLLTGVLGNATLATGDLPPDSPVQAYLEQIENAAARAAELCRQMLAYADRGRCVVRRISLNRVIAEATGILRPSFHHATNLEFDLARISRRCSRTNPNCVRW